MAGALGDVASLEQVVLVDVGIEFLLVRGVGEILRPAHEVRDSARRPVAIEDLKNKLVGREFARDFRERVGRRFGEQAERLFVAVNRAANEIVRAGIAHLDHECRHFSGRVHKGILHIPYMHAAPLVSCNYLITVHDVAEFLYDTGRGFKRNLRHRLVQRALQRAHRILAVSKATKRDIENLFGIPASHIIVVENAIDERYIQTSRREERRLVLERYQVNDPFLLYVGSAKPQKNISRLIEAFAVIKSDLREHPVFCNLRLLIIGDEISAHPNLRRAVLRTRMQNDVRFLGFLPIDTLRVFYQSAEVFVFPSLHEGFGLPPLEAMAQGTPVVT